MSARVKAAANAISKYAGMRFDGFWSPVEDLEPEDRKHALAEARAAQGAKIALVVRTTGLSIQSVYEVIREMSK